MPPSVSSLHAASPAPHPLTARSEYEGGTGSPSPADGCSALPGYQLGPVRVSPGLALAPMAGLTDLTFRRVVRRCGHRGLVVSEILSSEGLIRGRLDPAEYLRIAPDEHPVALQLSGADPERMAEAARWCEGEGADVVDINMGCPASKVTKGFCGAALLRDPALAARVAGAVVRAISLPVTVKMRLGWSESEMTFLGVARALEAEGVAGLALHARTRRQGYSGEADWDRVAQLKAVVSIPVVGNGDIRDPAQALSLWRRTGCDGLMVGRAAVKNPWIFRQIEELASTGSYGQPSFEERSQLILGHFGELLALGPPGLALHRMKSFLGKYTAGMAGAATLRGALGSTREPGALLEALGEWVRDSGTASS
ncbi:MAG: tRNA dihydrouridine synthase DusB [Acidobacteriota bacterium]